MFEDGADCWPVGQQSAGWEGAGGALFLSMVLSLFGKMEEGGALGP